MGEQRDIFKQWKFYIILICAMTVVIVVTFPRSLSSFKYLYQVGRPWMYEDLVSPIDFPILKTEAEIIHEREMKASTVVPCFQYSDTVWTGILDEFKQLLTAAPSEVESSVLAELVKSFLSVYEVGVVDDNRIESDIILLLKGQHASNVPSSSVFKASQVEGYIRQQLVSSDLTPQQLDYLADFPIGNYVRSNLVFNVEKTQEIHRQAYRDISPTKGIFYSGGLIVGKGEIVTVEIAQLLDSYKHEDSLTNGKSVSVVGLTVGRVLLACIVLACMISAIYFTDMKRKMGWHDFYYILTLQIILAVTTALVSGLSPKYILLVPYPIFALYLMSFYRRYVAFPMYSIMLLPLLLLVQNGVCLYFINLVAGVATMVSFKRLHRGWHEFVNAFYIFLTLVVSYLSFNLLWNGTITLEILIMCWMMLASSLCVVFAYPMIFVFEKMFGFISQRSLIELGETNNKLLREMSQKAPGTFQHSLQVANLAGEAAHELDVNEALVRAGALYHDIGKMKNPLCFVENQPAGMNYHAGLSLEDSAQQIVRHVDDGVEMAHKNNLPDDVVDFILTHHAQDMARFFYTTYVKNGGDPENKAPFSYHGKLPQTEEQVIVMIADSIEAASRTLKDYSVDSIRNLVEGIVNSKLNERQLVNANISLRDLTRLKDIFVRKVSQMYHDRIVYPKL